VPARGPGLLAQQLQSLALEAQPFDFEELVELGEHALLSIVSHRHALRQDKRGYI